MSQVKSSSALISSQPFSPGITLLRISSAKNKFLAADFRDSLPFQPNLSWTLKTSRPYGDFLRLEKLSLSERGEFIKSLPDKSADGLAVLKPSKSLAFVCDFYNRDGSRPKMCGNLSCCLALYARETGLAQEESFYFRVGRERVKAFKRFEKNGVEFLSPAPVKMGFFEEFEGASVAYSFASPGVPHGVVERKEPPDPSLLRPLALYLRHKNPVKAEEGMNVTFFSIQKNQDLRAVTFERGVEDWTGACGTGALSAALVFSKKYPSRAGSAISIKMPGGTLKVQLRPALALFSPARWGYG